jgi:phosphate transport system permease protein
VSAHGAGALRGPATPVAERLLGLGLVACGLVSVLITLGIVLVLAGETVAFFREIPIRAFLLDTQWTPLFADKHFGIWPLAAGTFLTTAIAVGVALPFGLLSAVYLSEFAPHRVRSVGKPLLEVLAGVPTVVYGYFALVTLTPLLQEFVPGLSGFNALSAGLVMGVMIVPFISSLSEDAISAVPDSLREGALALGAGRLPTVLRVVIPAARSGILAAILIAVARAVGETMIVAIAAGQRPVLTLDPRSSIETMTAYIVQVSMGDVPAGTLEYRTIFAVGTMLFLVTLGFNALGLHFARGARRAG